MPKINPPRAPFITRNLKVSKSCDETERTQTLIKITARSSKSQQVSSRRFNPPQHNIQTQANVAKVSVVIQTDPPICEPQNIDEPLSLSPLCELPVDLGLQAPVAERLPEIELSPHDESQDWSQSALYDYVKKQTSNMLFQRGVIYT